MIEPLLVIATLFTGNPNFYLKTQSSELNNYFALQWWGCPSASSLAVPLQWVSSSLSMGSLTGPPPPPSSRPGRRGGPWWRGWGWMTTSSTTPRSAQSWRTRAPTSTATSEWGRSTTRSPSAGARQDTQSVVVKVRGTVISIGTETWREPASNNPLRLHCN